MLSRRAVFSAVAELLVLFIADYVDGDELVLKPGALRWQPRWL